MSTETREPKPHEYHLEWKRGGEVVGYVACYRKGMVIADFYRTTPTLICDEPKPKEICQESASGK